MTASTSKNQPAITSFAVRLIVNPTTEPDSFAVESDYVLDYWTPTLGPTSVMFLRRIARLGLDTTAGTHTPIDLSAISQTLGLGASTSPNSRIIKTIRRLIQFRCAYLDLDDNTTLLISIPTRISPVSEPRRRHWPTELHDAHTTTMRAYTGDDMPAVSS